MSKAWLKCKCLAHVRTSSLHLGIPPNSQLDATQYGGVMVHYWHTVRGPGPAWLSTTTMSAWGMPLPRGLHSSTFQLNLSRF